MGRRWDNPRMVPRPDHCPKSCAAPSQQQEQCGEALQRARGRNPGEPGPEWVALCRDGTYFRTKIHEFRTKSSRIILPRRLRRGTDLPTYLGIRAAHGIFVTTRSLRRISSFGRCRPPKRYNYNTFVDFGEILSFFSFFLFFYLAVYSSS